MKSSRVLVLVVFLSTFAALPVFGQVCLQSQYKSTLACVPTLTAFAGGTNYEANSLTPASITKYYHLGTDVPYATPLGIGASYASQIASAPSAATASGFTVDTSGGAVTIRENSDFGPLFSDLPQTIGRHRLFIGASYQYMNFTKNGGQPLNNFSFPQLYTDNYFATAGTGNTIYYGVNQVSASASLSVQSINAYLTYGLTDRFEVSAVLPFSKASFGMSIYCPAGYGTIAIFGSTFCGSYQYGPNAETDTSKSPTSPWYEFFVYNNTSTPSRTASGLGDVSLRAKYQILRHKLQNGSEGIALGVEYRLPTGDPLNFKGSGATGVRPFLALGMNRGWFSPHLNIGYQYNGKSVNDVHDSVTFNTSTGYVYSNVNPASKLPNVLTGTLGVDIAVKRHLNLDVDLLGRKFSNDGSKAFTAVVPISGVNLTPPNFGGTLFKNTIVAGAKVKLTQHLLVAGNVMMDANPSTGMSYSPSPVFSVSYDIGKK